MEAGAAPSSGCGDKGKGASAGQFAQVEIPLIEVGHPLQRIKVDNLHAAVLELDEPPPPQLLKRSIHMDRGQAQAFPKLNLCEGELVAIVDRLADRGEPHIHL